MLSLVLLTLTGATWYVGANGAGDGSSPQSRLSSIGAALQQAAPNDTVSVAPGEYLENIDVAKDSVSVVAEVRGR
jgi:hypothetical protein